MVTGRKGDLEDVGSSMGRGRLIPDSFSQVGVEMPICWRVGIVLKKKVLLDRVGALF